MTYSIEQGHRRHTCELPALERAGGTRFEEIGMPEIAGGEVTPLAILENRAEQGRLYVALKDGSVVGFLIWSPKDGRAYIEEVSVHPDHAGHRLASKLINRLAEDVRGRHRELSLATFREVPWNGPYYRKLGFVDLARDEAGPEHDLSWQHQADSGLDMATRLFMTRHVQ